MRISERMKKITSFLLCLMMLVQYIPAPAFAAESDGLCEHHTEHHTELCGWVAEVPGAPCGHEHTEDCYQLTECLHEHSEECEDPCTHECTVESGCIIMEKDCHHTHDGDCGYAEAVAHQDCTTCQPVLTHVDGCGYVAPVAEVLCTCPAGEDGTITHVDGCGYVEGVAEVSCNCVPTVTHGGQGCTYVEGREASPCTHVCTVEVDSEDSCYKLLCSHAQPNTHDDACGYAAASEGSPCAYHCDLCLGHDQGEEPAVTETTAPEAPVMMMATSKAADTVVASGSCGASDNEGGEESVKWSLTEDGTLTISGTGAMADCTIGSRPWNDHLANIKSVVIESGVTTVGEHAFQGCTSLQSVTLTEGVTTISFSAFVGCNALTSITFPATVTTIESVAFASCSSLTSVYILAGVENVASDAFSSCAQLTQITVDEDNATYESEDGVLFNKGKTVLIEYPAGKSDTEYAVPETVTEIEQYAFKGCQKLVELTFSGNIEIGYNAFSNCPNLKTVRVPCDWNNKYVFDADVVRADHNWVEKVCTVCGGTCDTGHDWNTETGICKGCGAVCSHENWENGVCSQCGYVCTHENVGEGQCSVCGYCPHVKYENGFCTVCGGFEKPELIPGNETINLDDIYKISNAGQLYWFAALVNTGIDGMEENTYAGAVLANDIDLNPGYTFNSDGTYVGEGTPREWTPIGGNNNDYNPLNDFDGAGHTISGVYINEPDSAYVGLIGYLSGGDVKNVNIANAYICGNDNVGGVVGFNAQATVENCSFSGTVIGNVDVGGVVGENISAATVLNCYNTGTVKGESYVGGVVATNYQGNVQNCFSTGSVSSVVNADNNYFGGVVGDNSYGTTVTNCYYLSGCAVDGTNVTQNGIGVDVNDDPAADVEGSTTGMTAEQFASGEVAYKLNGDQTTIVFKQTIGEHNYPNFSGQTVYYGYTSCGEGAVAGYTNAEATAKPKHNWNNGVCLNGCGEEHSPHTGGEATCVEQKKCDICGASYGELATHDWVNGECTNGCGETCESIGHEWVDGECTHGCGTQQITIGGITVEPWKNGGTISAIAPEKSVTSSTNGTSAFIDGEYVTADELKAAVAAALAEGCTDITIRLEPEAAAARITPIRNALLESNVENGSIDLTLEGLESLNTSNSGASAFATANGVAVTQLRHVSLPDVGDIGDYAFNGCALTSLSAPKATQIYQYAFANSTIQRLEIPNAGWFGSDAFAGCSQLNEIDLSGVTQPSSVDSDTFEGVDTTNLTVYVKDADLKTQFEADTTRGWHHYNNQFAFTVKGAAARSAAPMRMTKAATSEILPHDSMYVGIKSQSNATSPEYNSNDVLWDITDGVATIYGARQPTLYTGTPNDQTIWAFSPNLLQISNSFAGEPCVMLSNKFSSETLFNWSDFRYAYQTITSGGPVDLHFEHLLSKVTVNLSYIEELNGTVADSVILSDLVETMAYNTSGVEDPLSEYEGANCNFDQTTWKSADNVHHGLVLPSSKQGAVEIMVKVGEQYFRTTFYPEGGFQPGVEYTVNVQVGCEHTGGTATCKEKATCDICGAKYGETLPHTWEDGVCKVCKTPCTHNFVDNTCTICGEKIEIVDYYIETSDKIIREEGTNNYKVVILDVTEGSGTAFNLKLVARNLEYADPVNLKHAMGIGGNNYEFPLLNQFNYDTATDKGQSGTKTLKNYQVGNNSTYSISIDGGESWTTITAVAVQAWSINNSTTTGGTITAPDWAIVGDEVALSVSANEGYALDTLTVTDAEDNPVTVDEETNTFTMPENGPITVSATFKHEHIWTYTASDNVITATCENCAANNGADYEVTITVAAPNAPVYNGNEHPATVTVSPAGALTAPEISYSENGCTNAGTVTASIQLGGKTASVTYAIAKAPFTITAADQTLTYGEELAQGQGQYNIQAGAEGVIELLERHTLTFDLVASTTDATTNGSINVTNVVVKNQAQEDVTDNFEITTVSGRLVINKSQPTIAFNGNVPGKTYDGAALANPTAEQLTITGATYDNVIFTWYKGTAPEGTVLGTAPSDAGTYYVVASIEETTNTAAASATSGAIEIAKATPEVTGLAAKTGLTYNGSAQALVTAGTTTGGTLEYSLNGTAWNTAIPTGTDAETYTVYYKVVGNGNYNDVAEQHIDVTIAKKPVTNNMVTVPDNQHVILGEGDFVEPTYPDEVTGTLTYSDGTNYIDYAAIKAVLATMGKGDYSIPWKFAGSGNYGGEITGTLNFSVVDILFTVGNAAATVDNAVTIKTNPTYGDSWDQIITINSNLKAAVGSAEDTEDSHFTLSVSGTPDAGEQSFSVYYNGTLNDKTFTNQVVCNGTVTVQKAKLTATEPAVTAKTYNSITVNAVEGQKYQCLPATAAAPTAESTEWQESGSFTGLDRDTDYVIYTYKPATDTNHASSDVVSTAVKTEKEQITAVTAPENVTLTAYYTTGEEVKTTLANTAAATTEGGTLSSLTISWTAPQTYETAPGAENTFSWAVTAPAGYKFAEGVVTSGTITVTNKAATAVNNVGADATITYSGTTYDVSGMFTKGEGAGAATYEIVAGGTGEGTLDGSKLTITKAGTFEIKMTTAANGNYAAGEATATLTVNKATTAAPENRVGYTIDYEKETITVAEGFEVMDGDQTVTSGSVTGYLGKELKVRYAETTNTAASGYTTFTVAARPAAPELTVTNETLKGKQDGSITGLDTTMEYSTDGNHWDTVASSTKFENLEAGKSIQIRVKATTEAPHGETKTCTIAAGNPITVTFDANGQTSGNMPQNLTGQSYGTKLTKPTDPTPTNEDFIFVGWYKDAAGSTAWNFDTDTLTQENVTVYAKWKQVYFSVGAEIKDHNGAIYNGNVTVKLMRGDSQIDSVTGTVGSFTFSNHVEAGMYNLVAVYTDNTGEHTKTELINVDHDGNYALILPAPGVNSHLNVSGNAQTPDVMVGGLDKEAEDQKGINTTVTIDMTVEGKTENQVPSVVVTAVESETKNNATIEYLDITITKQVDGGAKTEMSETSNILEIVVPYDITGKTELKVFRYHNGIQEFTEGQNTDRTFYYANGYIHIFTNKFSNYMIAYEVAHTITLDANGGTVTGTTLQTKGDGTLETLPTPTRDGYVFKGWYTAKTGGTKVTTATAFKENTTIYAQWGGYTITVKDSTNGTVNTDVTEAPKGTAVTMTVTPKYGYYLKTLVVKDEAGKTVTVGTDNKGTYGFLMPASNVTVTATFSKISTSTADPTNPKTGDTFQMTMWLNMMAISAIAATTLLTWNKKKKR